MGPLKLLGALALCLLCQIPRADVAANDVAANDVAASIDQKVDALLSKMTLLEKIGQMNQYNGFWDATGPAPARGSDKIKYDNIRQGLVGSMINVVGVERVREVQKLAVEQSRLGIPLIFGLDVIHGFKTQFPIPLAESSSWDLELMEKTARLAAVEAASQGINWTFAPMVDISEDARWGRVAEGAGEDPYLGAQIARARIKGFQGDDLARPDTIAATAKHFAAYGFAEAGRDYNRADISRYTLFNTVLPPFKAAVEADVSTFMNSFNTLNAVPATASAFLQRQTLKQRWGFQGFVVSDWASIQELVPHGFAQDERQAGELALIGGSDMDMESSVYLNHLPGLVEAGVISEELIDDAARRILRVKYQLGLFDDPYQYLVKKPDAETLYRADHLEVAAEAARSSIVLLKNKGKLLPLSEKQKNIAVIGPLASDKNSVLGTWRAVADNGSAVSLLEGLEQYTDAHTYAPGVKLSIGIEEFGEPTKIEMRDRSGIPAAVKVAEQADVVIMMLGEHGFQSGEGRSRTRLGLPGLQQELLEAVYEVNKNIVLLVASGRPLVLTWADEHLPAIVQTWQLGSQSGKAIADVLFGHYNPSGKLTMSFPRAVGQLPMTYRVMSTGRPVQREGNVFWSAYQDEKNDPLYPFGHGLSYSKFDYSALTVDSSDKSRIKVSVKVKNKSKVAGAEVVQLYIRDKVSSLVRPVKELKGFEKIFLEPRASKTVEFELTENELGIFTGSGKFLLEPGEFNVMVGGSSAQTLLSSFTL